MTKNCIYCGTEFIPRTRKSILCKSKECIQKRKTDQKRLKYQAAHPRESIKSCIYCGNEFTPRLAKQVTCASYNCKILLMKSLHKTKKYPRKKNPDPVECSICKKIFTPKDPRVKLCSDKCRYASRAKILKERYGYENPAQKPKDDPKLCRYCKKEIRESHKQGYFCDDKCYTSWYRISKKSNLLDRTCARCGTLEKIEEKRDLTRLCRSCSKLQNLTNIQALEILNSLKIEPLFNLPQNEDLFASKAQQTFKCHCGKEFETKLHKLLGKEIKSCGCTRSSPEIELHSFLLTLGIPEDEIKINTKPDFMQGLQLDLYLPKYQFALEYHGLAHHSERPIFEEKNIQRVKTIHYTKYKLCKANNVQLFQIFEDEWRDKREILESMIRQRLGKVETKIYARDCKIVEVGASDRVEFFSKNHISGDVRVNKAYGLVDPSKNLVLVISFRKPFAEKVENTIEIARLASCKNLVVVGGFQKILKHCLAELKDIGFERILTYADCRFGSGKVYEIAGFGYITHLKPNYFYEKEGIREGRFKHRKNNDLKFIEEYGDTERKQNNNLEWYAIYDAGNEKYELILD
jgi:hypothetical protein